MVVGVMPAKLGTKHHFAKLDPKKVRAARKRYAKGGISIFDLSLDYGISSSTMGLALSGKTWGHVKDEDDGEILDNA
jgi:hypothetical protein